MTTTKTNYYTEIPNIFVQSNNNNPSILKLLDNNKSIAFLKVIQDCSLIRETSVFNIEFILSKCGLTQRTSNIKMVRDFLSSMIKLNLIDLFGEDPNTLKTSKMIECKLNIFELDEDGNKKGYFKLLDSEWDAIINYQGDADRFNLLNVFCSIKSRMYYAKNPGLDRQQVAFPTYLNICDSSNILSEKSLSKYLDVLKNDLDLIAVGNAGDMMKDNHYFTANNVYTLKSINNWKNELRNGIDSFRTLYEEKGYTFIDGKGQETINERRKLTGRINALEGIKLSKGLSKEQEELLEQSYQEKDQLLTLGISESDRNIRPEAMNDTTTNDSLQEIFEEDEPKEYTSDVKDVHNRNDESVSESSDVKDIDIETSTNDISDDSDFWKKLDDEWGDFNSTGDNEYWGEPNPMISDENLEESLYEKKAS